MKRLQIVPLFLLVITSLILAACAPAATPAPAPTQPPAPAPTKVPPTELPAPKDIVDTAVADGRFTTLAAALTAAGLVDTLKGEGPFTVFAPTDEAFAKLPAGTVEDLLKPENLETLKNILLYHVVSGKVMASDVAKLESAETVAGDPVNVKLDMDKVYINDSLVTITDIETANGVIHVIDTVLLPPAEVADIVDTAVADGRFTTLVAAVEAAGLVDTLKGEGPYTLFAPTDEAFAKLPAGTVEDLLKPENSETLENILLYHVVPGKVMAADVVQLDGQMVDTALEDAQIAVSVKDGNVYLNETTQVIITDIETANGVIHVIDAVLLPPTELADIVDTAVADGRFTTLVAAVEAAGLVDTLKGEGPFTLFAPTDEAFAKLPAGTVEDLLKPENQETLKSILLYHVVPGKVMAADVVQLDGQMVDTALEGEQILITIKDGMVYLNETAQVIITDIETLNGVIHVIDAVLLPE